MFQYEPINKERTCAHCGKVFYISRNTRNKKYCSDECSLSAHRKHKTEYKQRVRQLQAVPKEEIVLSPSKKQSTDWATIVKICELHKVSYGQATAMGLLDNL